MKQEKDLLPRNKSTGLPPRSAKHPKPDPFRKTAGFKILAGILLAVIISIGIFFSFKYNPFSTIKTTKDLSTEVTQEDQNTQSEDTKPGTENADNNSKDEGEASSNLETTNASTDREIEEPASNQGSDIARESETVQVPSEEESPPSETVIRTYIVQKGDTLFSISKKFYGSKAGIQEITSVNNIKNNMIYVGMKLIIPDIQ